MNETPVITGVKLARRIQFAVLIGLAIFVFIVVANRNGSDAISNTPRPNPAQRLGYKLVFADDFDKLDIAHGDSNQHTWYPTVWFSAKETLLENVSASGSILSLRWTSKQGASDTSITTFSPDRRHYKAWRYGYFEARMRWNPVKGAWPAIWLIPVQDPVGQNIYNGTKRSGELDVFEGQGAHPRAFYGTIHEWINSYTDHPSRDNTFELPKDTDFSQFHTYGVFWNQGNVTWYFDNVPLHSEPTPAVFDVQDYFLILTMQEGVDWKGGNISGVNSKDMTLDVDWVRVWQK